MAVVMPLAIARAMFERGGRCRGRQRGRGPALSRRNSGLRVGYLLTD